MAAFERKLAERLDRLENEIRKLTTLVGKLAEITDIEAREIRHLQRQIEHIEHELRHHPRPHYPALSGITVTPL